MADLTIILPVPTDAPPPDLGHHNGCWGYHDQHGALLFYIRRFNDKDGGKRFMPLSYSDTGWIAKMPPEPRPLFGLETLGTAQKVVLTEGEKACCAARTIIGRGVPILTWPNGAAAVDKVDLTPLAGKTVCLWPDHDEPGRNAMQDIAQRLVGLGCSVTVVIPPPDKPKGWDLADALDEGWNRKRLFDWIEGNKHTYTSPETGQPTDCDTNTVPCCKYGHGHFAVATDGIFFTGTDKHGNELAPRWLCAPLHVLADTRNDRGKNWGRWLEWCDRDQRPHNWAMPAELLQGDGLEVVRELASGGLEMSPSQSAQKLLLAYLQTWPTEARVRCVDRLGWHGPVYVTPNEAIGQETEGQEKVVFQSTQSLEPAFATAGTVEEWRDNVAMLAAGNSRLVFALSVPFAGTLADITNEDSGGFHFRGGSSSGKSTSLKMAASVWGHPEKYPRLWRTTANGLEGLASLHNDGLLILDELGQVDPKEAGEAAYMLANGQGKTRATRTGAARQAAQWRLLFLSAGEISLSAFMATVGRKANVGQEIRMADIPADAGTGMGIFENLHDYSRPSDFANDCKDAATRYHGTVGQEWLRLIVRDRALLMDRVVDSIGQFVREVVPPGADGQVTRVAKRFGLVAVAGELASYYGLTGWLEGEAEQAAKICFSAWLDAFGGTRNREERKLLEQVRAFFEAHGASRFENMADTTERTIINRAGFWRNDPTGAREYLVLPESFKEICKGFDARTAARTLIDAGWIMGGEGGRSQQKPRLPGMGATRCYVFTAKMWEVDSCG